MTEEARQALRAALVELRKKPHRERWQEMINRGLIDENGKVLLPSRSPWNPAWGPEPESDQDDPKS